LACGFFGWAACNFTPYELGTGGDGGITDAGPAYDSMVVDDAQVNDGRVNDASPMVDGCVPVPETCDGQDNDCDTKVDEDFNFDSDPANCGSCGNTCNLSGTAGTCQSGDCQYECLTGFHDLNGDLNMPGSNGCEYGPCLPTGAEQCNFTDDDCDGQIDEGLNLDVDPDNCGGCFNVCPDVNVQTRTCTGGICGYDQCDAGYADVNPNVIGCEYQCPVNPPLAQEECNGVDDDCDGTIDELPITGLGSTCGPNPPGDTGECSWGTLECSFGVPACVGYQGPTAEICDNLDQDCDGVKDNGFDKDNDPNNCGINCTKCNLPHAVNGCSMGACTIIACLPGYVNSDGDTATGCDYQCTPTGPEVCDGVDNDCDHNVDENLTPPPGICNGNGPCAAPGGGGPAAKCRACGGVTRWRCLYEAPDYDPATIETDACGELLVQENRCDDVDGDCDGVTDESFPTKGDACDDGGIGICRGTGNIICDPSDNTQTKCDITSPGQTALAQELCNNKDDNCNGMVDEGAVDDTVVVDDGMGTTFRIDTYEASRPDATSTSDGSVQTRACSNPNVMPWRHVTWAEADAACTAAGKRLCTEAEWKLACQGTAGNLYPYGNTYEPQSCNGYDFDIDCLLPNDNEQVIETGYDYGCPSTADTCVSEFGAYDMSGNLKEWTSEVVGTDIHRVLGGAYNTIEQGLTCSFDFLAFDNTVALPSLGFRCCEDIP